MSLSREWSCAARRDWAHEGVRPSVAVQAVMAEVEPSRELLLDPPALERLFQLYEPGAWPEHDGSEAGYDRVGFLAAKVVLGEYLRDPRLARIGPADYHVVEGTPLLHACHLWDLLTVVLGHGWLAEGPSSPSTFQWGWAINCARRLCELGPVANPALLPNGGMLVAPMADL